MTERARLHARVHGRVQGVGYRVFARDAARAERLDGWVRNAPDGSVELAAEGSREALERFLEKLRAGPPSSRVTDVETSWDRLDASALAAPGRAPGRGFVITG